MEKTKNLLTFAEGGLKEKKKGGGGRVSEKNTHTHFQIDQAFAPWSPAEFVCENSLFEGIALLELNVNFLVAC